MFQEMPPKRASRTGATWRGRMQGKFQLPLA